MKNQWYGSNADSAMVLTSTVLQMICDNTLRKALKKNSIFSSNFSARIYRYGLYTSIYSKYNHLNNTMKIEQKKKKRHPFVSELRALE